MEIFNVGERMKNIKFKNIKKEIQEEFNQKMEEIFPISPTVDSGIKRKISVGTKELELLKFTNKSKCGFVVSIKESGELVFEIFGSNPGIVDLLGLHSVIEGRLRKMSKGIL